MARWTSFLWPEPARIEDRVKRVQETLWRIDRRIDHMAEDLTKIKAAETHIIANFDSLLAKVVELADRLANIKVDDPQTQIDIDTIAGELEAVAAKADPASV